MGGGETFIPPPSELPQEPMLIQHREDGQWQSTCFPGLTVQTFISYSYYFCL